jgi:predicted nuclease of predicted toxin-antitoxin system/uncharacterized protein (DUF433 family)
MGGKPCIRGLRFTVYDMASYLASGMSEDQILQDFPYLEKEDFQAVYEFFASIPERSPSLKLVVDENLAPGLATQLADLFPGSIHVSAAGLGNVSDIAIWKFAGANGFVFLTKDKDFVSLSLTLGPPPKVVLVQTSDCFTSQIEHIVRSNAIRFSEFDADAKRSLLLLK